MQIIRKIGIIFIIVSSISILLVVLFFIFFGLNIPYKLRFDKDNPDFRLERIIISDHRNQRNDLIYSLTTKELEKLINTSDSLFQLVYLYNLTCPTVKSITNILKDSIFALGRVEVFPISVSDRTLRPLMDLVMINVPIKRYFINSEIYYSSFFDIYEHNNNSKMNFLQEIRKDKFYEGTYVILFKGWNEIVFYDDDKYYLKYWNNSMSIKETEDKFISTITSEIKRITQNIK